MRRNVSSHSDTTQQSASILYILKLIFIILLLLVSPSLIIGVADVYLEGQVERY